MAVAWNRIRVLGSTVAGAVALLFADPHPPRIWPPGPADVGFLLVVGGAGVRLWASGYLDKAGRYDHISTGGPYRLVRHPLYVGNFLLAIGFSLIAFGWTWQAVLVSALIIGIHLPNILREEKKFVRVYGQSYLDYCAAVPRFFPRLARKRPKGNGSFHLSLVATNGEWLRLGLLLVLLTGLLVWGVARSDGVI